MANKNTSAQSRTRKSNSKASARSAVKGKAGNKTQSKAANKPATIVQRSVKQPGATIDDSAALVKLAACMKASPDMSVAEAVRQIGISDAASIRRLRGKFSKLPLNRRSPKSITGTRRGAANKPSPGIAKGLKSQPAVSASTSAAAAAPAVALSTHSKRTRKSTETFATAKSAPQKPDTRNVKPPRVTETVEKNSVGSKSSTSQNDGLPDGGVASTASPWMTAGLNLSSTMMHNQIQLYQQALKMAPVEAVVKQQVEFGRTIMNMFATLPLNMFATGNKK